MQALFIGFVEDSIYPPHKGVAIRIAYLLSSQFILSGNFSVYFDIDSSFRQISLERKMRYIDEQERGHLDGVQLYPDYKEFKKYYNTSRNNKALIVLQQKMERTVNRVFNRIVDDMIVIIKKSGIHALKMLEECSTFREYFVRHDFSEKKEKNYYRLSDMLLFNFDDNDGDLPTLFVLNDSLFDVGFDPDHLIMPELNKYSEKGFLLEASTFPDYNILTIADLNAIKFEKRECLQCFQDVVTTFCKMNTTPKEAFSFLQQDVLDGVDKFMTEIKSTRPVINHRLFFSSELAYAKLYIGMIPRSVIFKYYEFVNAAKDNTLQILSNLSSEEQAMLVPVIVVSKQEIISSNAEVAENESNKELLLKKSLLID